MPSRSEDFKTPLGRLAYTQHLFKPQEKDNGNKQFNCTILFDKSINLEVLQKAALEAAEKEWPGKAAEWIKTGLIKSPFLDGDGKQGLNKAGERNPGYAGCTFIRPTSGEEYQPRVYDQKKNPVMSAAECYSGIYAYAVLNAYTWDNPKNGKGISFGISLVQLAKDGERLGGGGGVDADKYLETIADEGDAPDSTKDGSGAGGLFS